MRVLYLLFFLILGRGYSGDFRVSVTAGVGDVKFIKVGETRYGLTKDVIFGFNLNGGICYQIKPWYATGFVIGWSNFSESIVVGETAVLDLYKLHLQNQFRFPLINRIAFFIESGMGLDMLNLYQMDRDSRVTSHYRGFSLRPGLGVAYSHWVIKALYNTAFFTEHKPLDWMEFNIGFEF